MQLGKDQPKLDHFGPHPAGVWRPPRTEVEVDAPGPAAQRLWVLLPGDPPVPPGRGAGHPAPYGPDGAMWDQRDQEIPDISAIMGC